MRLLISCLSILILVSLSAQAQEVMLESVCRDLPVPAPADGGEYLSGVDVNGNPVEFADLNNNLKTPLYPLEIPVELSVLKLLDLEIDPKLKEAIDLKTDVAKVTVYEDGRVEYNGQDISERVGHHCLDDGEEAASEKIAKEAVKAHGQTQKDDVVSGSEKQTKTEPKEETPDE